jgi:hypothetical protein
MYSQAGTPSLDLRFAETKSLRDFVSGRDLVTFSRTSDATFVGSNGLIQTASAGTPRFDHNPVTGESLGLLVEEQRTNLLLRSEEFDNASWTKTFGTITANAAIAPDGSTTADNLIGNISSTFWHARQTCSFVSGTTYSLSCYVKAAGANDLRLIFSSAAFGATLTAVYNLGQGAVISNTASSASILPLENGWYRCSVTATATATASTFVQIQVTANGDATSGIYIWGAQLEAGAFPTSYIPTGASTVTRAADVCSINGSNYSSWANSNEGTMYWDTQLAPGNPPSGTFPGYWSLNDGTSLNQINTYSSLATLHRMYVRTGGTVVTDLALPSFTAGQAARSAMAYRLDDIAGTTFGGPVTTDNSAAIPITNRLTIGGQATVGIGAGYIRRLTFWPQRLPNATLQAITQ